MITYVYIEFQHFVSFSLLLTGLDCPLLLGVSARTLRRHAAAINLFFERTFQN